MKKKEIDQADPFRGKRPLQKFPLEISRTVTRNGRRSVVVVAQVSREGNNGFRLDTKGSNRYDQEQLYFKTSHGQHLVLFNRGGGIPPHWMRLSSSLLFDDALMSDAGWGRGKLKFEEWRLPCNAIMEHLSIRPIDVRFVKNSGTTIKAWNTDVLPVQIGRIQAQVHVELAYEWVGLAFGTHQLTPLASFRFRYKRETVFEELLEHEGRLRSFLDFVWLQDHSTPELWFKRKGIHTSYYRRASVSSSEDILLKSLLYRGFLNRKKIGRWLVSWFELNDSTFRALDHMVRIIRNPDMLVDMRLVMALSALEALDKARTGGRRMDLHDRLLKNFSDHWQFKVDLGREELSSYLERLVWTRNEIVHAERHKSANDESIIRAEGRTKALYECLLIVRCMFLQMMGEKDSEIREYARSHFARIGGTPFRYF